MCSLRSRRESFFSQTSHLHHVWQDLLVFCSYTEMLDHIFFYWVRLHLLTYHLVPGTGKTFWFRTSSESKRSNYDAIEDTMSGSRKVSVSLNIVGELVAESGRSEESVEPWEHTTLSNTRGRAVCCCNRVRSSHQLSFNYIVLRLMTLLSLV